VVVPVMVVVRAMATVVVPVMVVVRAMATVVVPVMVVPRAMVVLPHTVHREANPKKQKSCN
jgi:hypothetical protein